MSVFLKIKVSMDLNIGAGVLLALITPNALGLILVFGLPNWDAIESV